MHRPGERGQVTAAIMVEIFAALTLGIALLQLVKSEFEVEKNISIGEQSMALAEGGLARANWVLNQNGWVRLEVPASLVGLEGLAVGGLKFSLYNGRAAWDRAGKDGLDRIYLDDSLPVGGTAGALSDSWNWISSNPSPFSGNLAHQSSLASGYHYHAVFGADPVFISSGDWMFSYVYVSPQNPPRQIILTWYDSASLQYRAYWGENLLNSPNSVYVSSIPPPGQWSRLEVPAKMLKSNVQNKTFEGQSLTGMSFGLYDGQATWDRAGIANHQSWLDEDVGNVWIGADNDVWLFSDSNPSAISGTWAHKSIQMDGYHSHYFYTYLDTMTIEAGDRLYAYINISSNVFERPSEVMLEWYAINGDWSHRAYWGADLISLGTNGTNSRRYMGPIPGSSGETGTPLGAGTFSTELIPNGTGYWVSSTGTVQGLARGIRQFIKQPDFNILAALSVYRARVLVNNLSCVIDGGKKYGIRIDNSTSVVTISGNAQVIDNGWSGLSSSVSGGTVAGFQNGMGIRMTQMKRIADRIIPASITNPSVGGITVVDGTCTVNSNGWIGSGILICQAGVDFNSTGQFDGVIYTSGPVKIQGGFNVNGAVYSNGPGPDGSLVTIQSNGTRITYDDVLVSSVAASCYPFMPFSWDEIAP